MDKIRHLDGIEVQHVDTSRLRMHLLTAGKEENPTMLFLHGNTSCSTIWEGFMLEMSENYYCVAPDLRGFGKTEDKLIDATEGTQDWIDDLGALIAAMELGPFHLIGHSLGGFICWRMIAEFAGQIRTATLMAPGPPMGFGGIHGAKGIANNEDFSGSGGGIVVSEFVERIEEQDRSESDTMFSPRNTMNRLFWKNGFRAMREEDILSAMFQIHTGPQQYPGDYKKSDYWPGVAPGSYGPVNALSPKYNIALLSQFVEASPKPPLLWIHGTDDRIIAEQSYSDPGYQGRLKLREGWPGQDRYPPQPMISQIEYALEKYKGEGGEVAVRYIDDCGHTPFIEKPQKVFSAMLRHIEGGNKKIK
ncbi:alpha/beta hydrolase [Fodinibius halophilus]|uniref:Alpha/beta hydrolase n=1 Tax=Fodinibius halophilus TaxID=1736908 RepID=A0A6M1T7Y5_9BACT|nr:alpha/beta hydrolase [Fodinibius halophilus]NGP89535.1 alpha/beta hydrolase [Fodinibius halophilus]